MKKKLIIILLISFCCVTSFTYSLYRLNTVGSTSIGTATFPEVVIVENDSKLNTYLPNKKVLRKINYKINKNS